MIKRLRHWLIEARKKKCRHCCLWCEYWDICRWDIPEKHGWIDIADDLPEPETLVLLSFEECDHTEVGQRIIYDDGKEAFHPWDSCLDPLAQMFMQEINRKRIGKNGIQKGTKLQIDTMRVKHIDMFDIATSADKLISSGIYTVNMILRALGEIPIDEDWADQHFITKNYSTIQEILEEQQKGGGKNAKTG